MPIIDTHCHIQFDAYDSDRDAVISSCKEKDIGLFVVGCDEKSSRDAVVLAETRTGAVFCSVGQHPTDSEEPFAYKTFLALAKSSKKVRAIGECGLDYYHLPSASVENTARGANSEKERELLIERQKELFFQHLNLSHELNLPLIIHCRDAHEDMIEMLMRHYGIRHSEAKQMKTASGTNSLCEIEPGTVFREHGVMHCFTGTTADAATYIDIGFMISFTGIITFTNQYDDVVRMVPLEKILIETDAPFLAPVPHRGKRNRPEYVEYVARRIAELKDVPCERVAETTTANAIRLFQLST